MVGGQTNSILSTKFTWPIKIKHESGQGHYGAIRFVLDEITLAQPRVFSFLHKPVFAVTNLHVYRPTRVTRF